MKKLVLAMMLVLTASILVVSCAKKEEPAAEAPAVDSTVVKADTTMAPADTTKK